MEWCAKDDVHHRNTMTQTGQARPTGGAPDPVGLAAAQEMQERLRPAEVILPGSRATGDHRPDSNVDIMDVCRDDAAVREAVRRVKQLLEGKYEGPRRERHHHHLGRVSSARRPCDSHSPVRPYGTGEPRRELLEYRPERDPEPDESAGKPSPGSFCRKFTWGHSPARKTPGWPGPTSRPWTPRRRWSGPSRDCWPRATKGPGSAGTLP